jgi:geranylgeranyl diphosphate synthase type I
MHSVVAQSSFERALEAAITRYDSSAPITAMIRYHFGYASEAGDQHGKRLRPMLLLTVAQEEGGSIESALDAACAIEILHNYSLVHDDIEDGDRIRHGRDTVWAKWGTAHGINAGDSLCAISYLALLESDVPRPAERTVAMTRALHEANLAMCAGQGRDIAFEVEARVTMDRRSLCRCLRDRRLGRRLRAAARTRLRRTRLGLRTRFPNRRRLARYLG